MSTPAVIAEPCGDEWRGRYHNWDGYPTGVGKAVWDLVQDRGEKVTRKTLLLDHTAWSTIVDVDWSKPVGYLEPTMETVKLRNPRCYCHHGDISEEGWWERSGDASSAEWAYVIGPRGLVVEKRVGRFTDNERWETRGYFPYAGSEPDWEALESGATQAAA